MFGFGWMSPIHPLRFIRSRVLAGVSPNIVGVDSFYRKVAVGWS